MNYSLYRRTQAECDTGYDPSKVAWELWAGRDEKKRWIWHSNFNEPVSLEQFARDVANHVSRPIKAGDRIGTIPESVFVPINGYVDSPASAAELVEFSRVYRRERLKLGRRVE